MTADPDVLRENWRQAAREVYEILCRGEDCCFLTLGDALLYSTYIYLLRELQAIDPVVQVVTVPGITAFSAAAALTELSGRRGQATCHDRSGFGRFQPVHPGLGSRRHRGAYENRPAAGKGARRAGGPRLAGSGGVRLPRGHAGAADRNRPAAIARIGGTDRLPFHPDYPGKPAVAGHERTIGHESLFCRSGTGRPRAVDRESPAAARERPAVHLRRLAGQPCSCSACFLPEAERYDSAAHEPR